MVVEAMGGGCEVMGGGGSNLTDWISSSNRSTRKSRHCSPNDGLAKLSRHIESTAANRTSGK